MGNAPRPPGRCDCGLSSRRACGLLEHGGFCLLPDPRFVAPEPSTGGAEAAPTHNPKEPSSDRLAAARAALARLTRCGAHARTTGQPCKKYPIHGRLRCANHGGLSTGAPVTSGRRTLKRQRVVHYVTLMTRVIGDLYEKPPPQPVAWDDNVEGWRPAVPDGAGGWRFDDDPPS